MDNVNFIVTMEHYSKRYGADGSARGFIRTWQEMLHKKNRVAVTIRDIDGDPRGVPVQAYVHQGQWIAQCECGSCEFVNPNDPVFFCWGCVNRANNSYLRPVEFPAFWQDVERILLERPVNDMRGASELERAGLAQPAVIVKTEAGEYPLVRSWKADEPLEELEAQNAVLVDLSVEYGKVVVVDLTVAQGVDDGI